MVTPDHHGALVDRLVQETQPVRRLWSVRARLAVFWLLGTAAIALCALAAPRPDLLARLRDPSFAIGLVLLLLATNVAALFALRSAVPGRSPSRSEAALALALAVVAAAFTSVAAANPAASRSVGPEWACALRTFVVAMLPWVLLLVAIRRGAPVRVTSAGAYAGAAALLLATAMLRTGCPQDGAAHWLKWHFAAVLVGSALSAAVSAAWLQTWRRP